MIENEREKLELKEYKRKLREEAAEAVKCNENEIVAFALRWYYNIVKGR